MTLGSLFSGIGGLELGLERAGFGPVRWQAEIDPYCRSVLARHWPDARRFEDVREVVRGSAARVGLVCGGFPCQPVSTAGDRRGEADPRWLWPEFARVIDEIEPAAVVIENVPGLRTLGLRRVLADLAALGFDAEWSTLRASDLGAPHRRTRLFIVATHPDRCTLGEQPGWGRWQDWAGAPVARLAPPDSDRVEVGHAPAHDKEAGRRPRCAPSDADGQRRLESAIGVAKQRGWVGHCGWDFDSPARVDDGLSGDMERRRRALGNAVVPQCGETVGRALMHALRTVTTDTAETAGAEEE
jgi:site-specific DNA-cytosine methylase